MARLETLRGRNKLSDTIYEEMESAIIRGIFKPGEKVYEDEVAAQLGTSTTPVREAIARLCQEGLLETGFYKTPTVIRLTPKKVKDIFEVREVLEGLAVRLAIQKPITPTELEQLRGTQELAERSLSRGDLAGYFESNESFHWALVDLTENEILIASMRKIRRLVRLLAYNTMQLPGRPERSIEQHLRLIEAMKRGDATTAETLMRDHIAEAKDIMLDKIRQLAASEDVKPESRAE
ncbi:MAG: GntR family transcriptional regulator [Bacillota bacterium]